MIELFERGGIMMYPLAIASFIAFVIIIERALVLRKKKIIIPDIINVIEQFNSLKDVELARNICSKFNGPLPNLIKVGLDNNEFERAEIKELIEDQGRQEVRQLERGLTLLETIAVSSPLLGLLGTVLGMIQVFYGYSGAGYWSGIRTFRRDIRSFGDNSDRLVYRYSGIVLL